jgi:Polyketide cyclase / dehydrase and lipid transport
MKRVLLLLLLAAAAFSAYVATRPSAFRVERSALIVAPREVVFRNLEDFHRWGAWSPWEKLDPKMERSYDGPSSGVGASYRWHGNREVGEGRMTVTGSKPPTQLAIRLEFIAPLAATNEVVFSVSPHIAGTTEVRWAMTGNNDFLAKAASLFMNVDAMVGGAFEQGLADLKRVSEEQASAAAEEAERAVEAAASAEAAAAAVADAPALKAP